MLISKETTLQVLDNIPTINGLGLEPVIALRDVKEIIKAVPEVDAVPLDKLCEWLAKYGYPCAIIDTEQCNLQECDVGISYSQEASRNCWKTILANWMEEQNENK